jgi:peptidoglycan/LPS O-acetylase OafA/YrhL
LGFSAYQNTRILFKITPKNKPDILYSLNGIRFISMTWVVLGHVFGELGSYPTNNYIPYLTRVRFDKNFITFIGVNLCKGRIGMK